MFSSIIDWIIELINKFGLWGVFFGSLLEELIAPIPSPLVMMGAGAALLGKYEGFSLALGWDMTLIAIVGGIGAVLGSYLPFYIGYFGGKPLIAKTSKFTGVSWKSVEKIQAKLENSASDEITITSLRAIPVMPSVLIAVTCGLLRINFFSYTISFVIGGIIRNFVFLIIGWQVGSAYINSASTFENITDWVTKIIVGLGIIGLGYLYWRRSKQDAEYS